MPTSTYAHINTVVKYLEDVRPVSILDVGLGNGKMGFLARDLLDVMIGQRALRHEWRVRIDGIEVYEPYIQAHQRAIYDTIHVGDAFDVIDTLGEYEMVIIGDVLEHFDRDRAETFLDKASLHASRAILLSIPLGEKWTQDDIYGNDYERHRSFWHVDELRCYASQAQGYTFKGLGLYGSFLIEPAAYRTVRLAKACERAQARFGLEPAAAVSQFSALLDLLGPDVGGELQLAELLTRQQRFADAATRLDRVRGTVHGGDNLQHFVEQLRALTRAA